MLRVSYRTLQRFKDANADSRASRCKGALKDIFIPVRDKNGPGYYYDFNAADYRCKSRSCNALSHLSAPSIGTVIDSSVFMRIDVAAAWRAISSSSS